MADKPRILCVCDDDGGAELPGSIRDAYDVVVVHNPIRALALAGKGGFAGVFVTSAHLAEAMKVGRLLQNERILEGMVDGVALLDSSNAIIWANERLRRWSNRGNIVGENFYAALGSPEILGPDYCPFRTAMSSGESSGSTLKTNDGRSFQTHAAPLRLDSEGPPQHLIVSVRDVTGDLQQQQKLAAIHKAGDELSDMTADEIREMDVEQRIDLLKANILHYTQDLLHYDVVEIRLVEPNGMLRSLLASGLDLEAEQRTLYARPKDNGVTGFVASTGKSYLCEDTATDPLFLEGFKGSKSSLTVPITLHDTVIGTFNVESPQRKAFTESDQQFLEIFSRNIALALNTLQLLAVEKASTAHESVEAIHREVALPVDEILNDAVYVMERYDGADPQFVERMRRLLKNARDIKQVIHQVGERMSPAEAIPAPQSDEFRKVRNRRVLVVDAEEEIRGQAHALLEPCGCLVETAHDGEEAMRMVRAGLGDEPYDVIISAIHLPDMSGHKLQMRLKPLMDPVPLALSAGFGHDPGHTIVKARENGLNPKALLYKPFRLEQLLGVIQTLVDEREAQPQTAP